MKCPSCHYEQPDSHTTCEACGLIFAKYNPNIFFPKEEWRRERDKIETPENGWTTHHLGKFTWKSTGWTSVSEEGTTTIKGGAGILLGLLIAWAFLGFPFVFIWERTAMPYYFAGLGFLLGWFLFVQSFSKLREKRAVENIPLSTIRAMAPGQVEIRGTAVEGAKLMTPFTQQACVYYEYRIEQYTQQGKDSSWHEIDRGGSRETPFTLDDGTGKATVYPGGADTIFADSFRVESRGGRGLSQAIQAFVEAKGLGNRLNGQLRFTECCFLPGQEVFVMGVYQKKDDLSGDGEIFVGKGQRPEDLFILSDKSREAVERGFLWSAVGSMVFGIVLIVGSVWGFLKTLGIH